MDGDDNALWTKEARVPPNPSRQKAWCGTHNAIAMLDLWMVTNGSIRLTDGEL